MASASSFRTSLCRRNVICTSVQRFRERKHRRNDQPGRNALPCNVMHTNQGPVYAFSGKSRVQTANESDDLNKDFEASNKFA